MEIDKKSQVRDSERKLSFVIRQAVAVSLVCRHRQWHIFAAEYLVPTYVRRQSALQTQ